MFTKSWLFLFQQQVSDQYILTYKQIVNLFIPVILFCIYQWFVAYIFVTKPTDNLKPVQETEKQILKIFWVENKFRN